MAVPARACDVRVISPTQPRWGQVRGAAERALAAGIPLSRVLALLRDEWRFEGGEWQYTTLHELVSPSLYRQGLRHEALVLHEEGMSWRAIAAEFNARDIPTPRGLRQWSGLALWVLVVAKR